MRLSPGLPFPAEEHNYDRLEDPFQVRSGVRNPSLQEERLDGYRELWSRSLLNTFSSAQCILGRPKDPVCSSYLVNKSSVELSRIVNMNIDATNPPRQHI